MPSKRYTVYTFHEETPLSCFLCRVVEDGCASAQTGSDASEARGDESPAGAAGSSSSCKHQHDERGHVGVLLRSQLGSVRPGLEARCASAPRQVSTRGYALISVPRRRGYGIPRRSQSDDAVLKLMSCGNCHANWSEHFFRGSVGDMGICIQFSKGT